MHGIKTVQLEKTLDDAPGRGPASFPVARESEGVPMSIIGRGSGVHPLEEWQWKKR